MSNIEELLAKSSLSAKQFAILAAQASNKSVPRQASREAAMRRFMKELTARTSEEHAQVWIEEIVSAQGEIAEGKLHTALDEWDMKQNGGQPTDLNQQENAMTETVNEAADGGAKAEKKTRRSSPYADKKLFPNAKSGEGDLVNPRRAGSFGHTSYQIIMDNPGITGAEFAAKGGRWNDLSWDIERDNVRVE